ncbi:MAG: BRCT domain-containing protein [Nakamurella sp.]
MSSTLQGQSVAITGAMNGPLYGVQRTVACSMVRDAGGRTVRAVSRKTTLLVASRVDTRKALRAQELGVQVVSPSELAVMLGYPALW